MWSSLRRSGTFHWVIEADTAVTPTFGADDLVLREESCIERFGSVVALWANVTEYPAVPAKR